MCLPVLSARGPLLRMHGFPPCSPCLTAHANSNGGVRWSSWSSSNIWCFLQFKVITSYPRAVPKGILEGEWGISLRCKCLVNDHRADLGDNDSHTRKLKKHCKQLRL